MGLKTLTFFLAFLTAFNPLFAAVPTDIKNDKLRLGNPANTSSDKVIELNKGSGAANPKLKWNAATSTLQFSNNGTDYVDMGSGSGGDGGYNYVPNPSGEFNTTNWTATNATITRDTDAADQIKGKASLLISSSTDGGVVCTDAMTLFKEATGDGEFGAIWKGDGTKWKLELRASPYSSTDVLHKLGDTLTNSINWIPFSSTNYPLTDLAKLCFVHIGTGSDSLNAGKVTWREAGNIVGVQPGEIYAGSLVIPYAASCLPATTSTTFANLTADTDCPVATIRAGNASPVQLSSPGQGATAVNISAPSGFVRVVFKGTTRYTDNIRQYGVRINSALADADGKTASDHGFQLYNGNSSTVYSSLHLEETYRFTSAISSVRFDLQARAEAGTFFLDNQYAQETGFKIDVYWRPLSVKNALSFSQTPPAGFVTFGSDCNAWKKTNASFTGYDVDASCTINAVGTNIASVAGLPSISADNLNGQYLAIYQGTLESDNVADECEFQFYDGTSASGYVATKGGSAQKDQQQFSLIGLFSYTGFQSKTITLQSRRVSGTTSGCNLRPDIGVNGAKLSLVPITGKGVTPITLPQWKEYALTVTDNISPYTVRWAKGIPYKSASGTWRMLVDIMISDHQSMNGHTITVSGVTFATMPGTFNQILQAGNGGYTLFFWAATVGGTSNITISASGNFTNTWLKGDVELAGKPTFVD